MNVGLSLLFIVFTLYVYFGDGFVRMPVYLTTKTIFLATVSDSPTVLSDDSVSLSF